MRAENICSFATTHVVVYVIVVGDFAKKRSYVALASK